MVSRFTSCGAPMVATLAMAMFAGIAMTDASRAVAQPIGHISGKNVSAVVRAPSPMYFEENLGQASPDLLFLCKGPGYASGISAAGARFRFGMVAQAGGVRANPRDLSVSLVAGNAHATARGIGRLPGRVNYLMGRDPSRWRTGIATFSSVRVSDVYPGIDMVYCFDNGRLRYDFVVKPGGNPRRIALRYDSPASANVARDGSLEVTTAQGVLAHTRPVIYQTVNGRRAPVSGGFVVCRGASSAGPTIGFRIARYDTRRTLIIDPSLAYSTYLGGAAEDYVAAVAVDGAGCAYVTGRTQSDPFPTTSGAFSTTYGGGTYDCFVTKIAPDARSMVYSTYIGGSVEDWGNAVAADPDGHAYVTGLTYSDNFPTTTGALFTAAQGGGDAFVTKLSADGSSLVYSTYLGGPDGDLGYAIAVDDDRNAYVGGDARVGFPVTVGAADQTYNGGPDGFIAKLEPTGAALVYATYLGGTDTDHVAGIAVDGSGAAYVAGQTAGAGFPTTAGAFDSGYNGSLDAFVTKLSPDGSAWAYSTFLGAEHSDLAFGIACTADGCAVVGGWAGSASFPTTAGAYDTTYNGVRDTFVARFSQDGSSLVYSTFIGGNDRESIYGLALDSTGRVWATGETNSSDFPTTADAVSRNPSGGGFVTCLSADGSALLYSTFLGGTDGGGTVGYAVACDPGGSAYVVGATVAADFPTTPGVVGPASAGGTEGFVVKLDTRPGLRLDVPDVPGQVGQTIQIKGILSRANDGARIAGKTIRFVVDGIDMGAAVTDSTGVAATVYTVPERLVDLPVRATFEGDAQYGYCFGTGFVQCRKASTTLYVIDRAGSAGQWIYLRGYLRREHDRLPLPGEKVSFAVAGTGVGWALTNADGRATVDYQVSDTLSVGDWPLSGTFAGSDYCNASADSAVMTITAGDTAIFVIDRTGAIGQQVYLRGYLRRTIDRMPLPARTLTFTIDGTVVGTAATDFSGRASLLHTIQEGAGAGSRQIMAEFAGDASYDRSNGAATMTVSKADTYLFVIDRTGARGQSIYLRGYLRRQTDRVYLGGRTVTFSVDGTVVGSVVTETDGSGRASFLYTIPDDASFGAHPIGGEFAGDASHNPTTGAGVLTVT